MAHRAREPNKINFQHDFWIQRHFYQLFDVLRAYYQKKVDLAQPRARPHAGAPAESIFNIIFEFSAVFTCYLTYYKPIAKKVGLVRPLAHGEREARFFLHL